MQKQPEEVQEAIRLTEAAWRDQRLIAAELRRRREAAGITQEQLAEKMGEPYTVETISQYEDGSQIPMETWTVFAMVEALDADLSEISPKSLLARRCSESGYADLNEETRQIIDGVIGAILKGQRPQP